MISSERLNGIRAFVQAADAGSFSRAAVQLGLSKSTVGKAIARLEQRLQVRLFQRTTRSLALTEEGRAFHESCTRALAELEGAEAVLAARAQVPTGRLRVDLPVLFGRRWVLPALLDLATRHEALEIEAAFSSRRADFTEDRIDLAVRIGDLDDTTGLTARRLGLQRLVLCASTAYLARHGRPAAVGDIARHQGIAVLRDHRADPWLLAEGGKPPRPVAPPGRLRLGSVDAVADAALAGHGLAQLPLWLVADDLRRGALEAVLPDCEPPGLPIHALWPTAQPMTARLRTAIDALVDCFLPTPPWCG